MPAILDHIQLGCGNVYTTAFDLMKTTNLGHYDAGFSGDITVGCKIVPLGDSYLEIASLVDPFATAGVGRRPWWYTRALALKSSIFSGVCLRVNTREELDAIAKRHGSAARPTASTRTPPDGPPLKFWEAPSASGTAETWATGRPTWCCWEDRLYRHPSGQPVVNAPGLVQPMGVTWMEMGGTKGQMHDWLGQNPDDLKMTFNGKPAGLYAIGVRTDAGDVEIRRPSAIGA